MYAGLIIIENCIDDEIKLNIANAVEKAQDFYEDSWVVDTTSYKLSHMEAAEKAVKLYKLDSFWGHVIGHWIFLNWNDVHGWAESVIKELS